MTDGSDRTPGGSEELPASTREQQLRAIVEEYSSRLRAGEAPDPYELMVLHLSLAQELEKRLQVAELLHAQNAGSPESPSDQGGAVELPKSVRTRLGRYELRERLGAGASAVVYRAWDPRLQREVALKVLREEVLNDASVVERFDREAPIIARLRHPNIVWLHESGEADGHRYLDLEFVAGQSLARRLAREPRLSFRESSQLVAKLAEALDYAHRKGIVHRDIAPTNILLDKEGEPQLADFGLARQVDCVQSLTLQGQLLGTPPYMSPELAAGGARAADRRSDIYSLGVVLYQLLTGRLPFEPGDSYAHLVYRIIHKQPLPLRSQDVAIPAVLERICLKALEKDPADRFLTAAELGDELRRWLNDEPSRIQRSSPLQVIRRWARRNRLVAWTATVAAVIVACVAALAVWKNEQARLHAQAEASIQVVALHDAVRQQLRGPTYERRDRSVELLEQVAKHRRLLAAGPSTDRLDLQTRSLFAWTLAMPEFLRTQVGELDGVGSRSWPVAIHPDGNSLAVGTSVRPILWRRGEDLKLPDGLANPLPGSRLVFHTDGQLLLCAPDAGGLEVWDAELTRIVGRWRQESAAGVLAFGMSSDSPAVTACTTDGVVHVLSLPALEENSQWAVEQSSTRWTAAAFTEKATHVARGNAQGRVQVYAADGQLVQEINADGSRIETLAWSPDARLVAVGSRGGVVRLWNVQTWQPSSPLFLGPTGVGSIAFTPDGQWLIAGARHAATQVWDVRTGRPIMCGPGPTSPMASSDGRFLGIGAKDLVAFCELSRPQIIRELSGHDRSLSQIAWSNDGRRLATIDVGFQVHVWDVASGRPIWSTIAPSEELYSHRSNAALAFSSDGRLLAYASGGNHVSHLLVADLESGTLLYQGDLPGGFEHLASTGADQFLLAREERDPDKQVWNSVLYEWQAGQPPLRAKVLRAGKPSEIGFFDGELSRDGKLFFWAGPRRPASEQRLEIWNLATGKVDRYLRPTEHPEGETNFRLSADGNLLHLSTGGSDNRLLNLQTGTQQVVLGRPVAISARGEWLLMQQDSGVQLCPDVQEAVPWIEFAMQGKDVLSMSALAVNFSPCGRFLAWSDNSGALRIAELAAWQRSVEELERRAWRD